MLMEVPPLASVIEPPLPAMTLLKMAPMPGCKVRLKPGLVRVALKVNVCPQVQVWLAAMAMGLPKVWDPSVGGLEIPPPRRVRVPPVKLKAELPEKVRELMS